MRYFRSDSVLSQALREQVMFALGQPNGMALEPWPVAGDFTVNGQTYLSLGDHHTTGEFWESIIEESLSVGVVEITEAEYQSNRPVVGNMP